MRFRSSSVTRINRRCSRFFTLSPLLIQITLERLDWFRLVDLFLQRSQHGRTSCGSFFCFFGRILCRTAINVQQGVQFSKAGRLFSQFFLLCKGLCHFDLCGLLLLFKVLQSIFGICNTVSEIVDGIVQTNDVAARIIAQRHRVAQLCPEYGLILYLHGFTGKRLPILAESRKTESKRCFMGLH